MTILCRAFVVCVGLLAACATVPAAPARAGFRAKGPVTGPEMTAPSGYRFELEEACTHLDQACSWVLVHIASGSRGRKRARPVSRRRRRRAVRSSNSPRAAGAARTTVAWEQVRTSEVLLTPAGRAAGGARVADGGEAKSTRSGGHLDCPAGTARRCGKLVDCKQQGGRCVDRNRARRCLRRLYVRTCRRRCTCR